MSDRYKKEMSYDQYLFACLLAQNDSDFTGMDYDERFDLAIDTYEKFVNSGYDNKNKSSIECMLSYIREQVARPAINQPEGLEVTFSYTLKGYEQERKEDFTLLAEDSEESVRESIAYALNHQLKEDASIETVKDSDIRLTAVSCDSFPDLDLDNIFYFVTDHYKEE